MACGLPVIASRQGALAEAVQHGHDGWLVPPGDAQVLVRKVRWRSRGYSGQRGSVGEDRSVRSAASFARSFATPSRPVPSMHWLRQSRVELERVAFLRQRDFREPRMQGIDEQVVFGGLNVGGNP